MSSKVKNKTKQTRRRDGKVKVTAQGQVSIPRQAMREAGIRPGDQVQARVEGPGRIVFEVVTDPWEAVIGSGGGLFDRAAIERTRDEWDRSY